MEPIVRCFDVAAHLVETIVADESTVAGNRRLAFGIASIDQIEGDRGIIAQEAAQMNQSGNKIGREVLKGGAGDY